MLRPRAKVNLSLSVGPRGRDGYHPLESVFLRIGLADDLTVAFGTGVGGDVLTVGGLAGCEVDGNLVSRAFRAVRHALGQDFPPLVAHLDKRIPVAAGLGGGSADAAAAVDCALQMWGVGMSPDAARRSRPRAGCRRALLCPQRRCGARDRPWREGRAASVARDNPGLLLVTPPILMSTAAVFARFDELDPPTDKRLPPAVTDLSHLRRARGPASRRQRPVARGCLTCSGAGRSAR